MSESIAKTLREEAAACRLSFTWLGVRKALDASQKAEAAAVFDAAAAAVGASKQILNTRNKTFRKVTGLKSEIIGYWRGATLPFPEPGIRLLRRAHVADFDERLRGLRRRLDEAVEELNEHYPVLREEARERLGRLYNEADYPEALRGLFEVHWDFPSVEPPEYLAKLSPRLYEAEQARVAGVFNAAIKLAEEAFTTELHTALTRLADRLTDGPDGRKVLHETAVTNIQDFIQRFRTISVRSNDELDAFVEQTNALIGGLKADDLRNSATLRGDVRAQVEQIAQALDTQIITAPRRRIRYEPEASAGAAS